MHFSVGGGIPANGYVPTSEMDSSREDLLYGTYRAAMKLTLTPGTCAAFFWVISPSFTHVRGNLHVSSCAKADWIAVFQ